jgi:hypothetical protein
MSIDIKDQLKAMLSAPRVSAHDLNVCATALAKIERLEAFVAVERAEIERLEWCIEMWLRAEKETAAELTACRVKLDSYTDRLIAAGLMT